MKSISVATLVLLASLAWAGAEELSKDQTAHRTGETVARTDEIFESILQSLPSDMKARVDSASGAKGAIHVHVDNVEEKPASAIEKGKIRQEDALGQLPDELRERVRKTIKEMENEQQKRAVQFKDRKQPLGD